MVLFQLKWSKTQKVLTMLFGRSKTQKQALTTLMWQVVTRTSILVLIITSIFTRQWLEAHLLLCSTSKTEIYNSSRMASFRSTTLVCLIARFCSLFFRCLLLPQVLTMSTLISMAWTIEHSTQVFFYISTRHLRSLQSISLRTYHSLLFRIISLNLVMIYTPLRNNLRFTNFLDNACKLTAII